MGGTQSHNLKSNLFFSLTVDLSTTASRYSRLIVVPRVPVLKFMLPEFQLLTDEAHLSVNVMNERVRIVMYLLAY